MSPEGGQFYLPMGGHFYLLIDTDIRKIFIMCSTGQCQNGSHGNQRDKFKLSHLSEFW